MQTPDSQIITGRFFEALQRLKAEKAIGGPSVFAVRYGVDRRNLERLNKERHRDGFQLAWLTYLVEDYGVSPLWLLTGEGDFHAPRGKPRRKVVANSEKD